jgi:hypothetical protein
METFKRKVRENYKFVFTLLACILLTSITMILIHDKVYPKTNNNNNIQDKDKDNHNYHNLTYVIDNINNINATLRNCVDDLTIDTDVTIKTLTTNISSLEEIKSSLSQNNDEASEEIITKITSCIDSTELLYNYCIDSLTAKNNVSYVEMVSQINTLTEDCLAKNSTLYSYDLKLEFTEESIDFFNKLNSYLMTLDTISKYQNIKDAQTNEFLKGFNLNVTELSSILQDLQPAVTKIREDERSLDVILNDLKDKEEKFLDIKKSLSTLSVPENCSSLYNQLNDTFTLYANYLNTMRLAVVYEKSSSSYKDNKRNIDKYYSNAYSKYSDVKTSLKTLNESLENF